MKLGNTREEMQRNYSETIRKSRKVGRILAIIGVFSSVLTFFKLKELMKESPVFGIEHYLLICFVVFCPAFGYIGGHMYYYGFRRMSSWLECMSDSGDSNGSGCLPLFLVFGPFGVMIAYTVVFSLFVSIGMFVGMFDWIKIHIDAMRYGLEVK